MEAQGNPIASPRAAAPRGGPHPAEAVVRSVSEACGNCREDGLGGCWERRFALAGRVVRLASNSQALLNTLSAPFSNLPQLGATQAPPELDVEVVTGVPRQAIALPAGWDGTGFDTVHAGMVSW